MMDQEKRVNIGVGFVTGRKSFRNIVRTYVENWNESGLVNNINTTLNLFVAYDLKYTNTKLSSHLTTRIWEAA
ncbi:MAG: hypothetical protein K6T65_03175 [Peptococcaceae bacterium]|nr:hypothetical protein [Peptococcaceae bacterium]